MNNHEFGDEARRIIGDLCGIERDPVNGDSYFTPGKAMPYTLYDASKMAEATSPRVNRETGIVYRAKSLVPVL